MHNNSAEMLTYARTHNARVVIRINADVVLLEFKCKLAEFAVFQFVLVQVRPAPDPCVDDVRKTLPSGHLKTQARTLSTAKLRNHLVSLKSRPSTC